MPAIVALVDTEDTLFVANGDNSFSYNDALIEVLLERGINWIILFCFYDSNSIENIATNPYIPNRQGMLVTPAINGLISYLSTKHINVLGVVTTIDPLKKNLSDRVRIPEEARARLAIRTMEYNAKKTFFTEETPATSGVPNPKRDSKTLEELYQKIRDRLREHGVYSKYLFSYEEAIISTKHTLSSLAQTLHNSKIECSLWWEKFLRNSLPLAIKEVDICLFCRPESYPLADEEAPAYNDKSLMLLWLTDVLGGADSVSQDYEFIVFDDEEKNLLALKKVASANKINLSTVKVDMLDGPNIKDFASHRIELHQRLDQINTNPLAGEENFWWHDLLGMQSIKKARKEQGLLSSFSSKPEYALHKGYVVSFLSEAKKYPQAFRLVFLYQKFALLLSNNDIKLAKTLLRVIEDNALLKEIDQNCALLKKDDCRDYERLDLVDQGNPAKKLEAISLLMPVTIPCDPKLVMELDAESVKRLLILCFLCIRNAKESIIVNTVGNIYQYFQLVFFHVDLFPAQTADQKAQRKLLAHLFIEFFEKANVASFIERELKENLISMDKAARQILG